TRERPTVEIRRRRRVAARARLPGVLLRPCEPRAGVALVQAAARAVAAGDRAALRPAGDRASARDRGARLARRRPRRAGPCDRLRARRARETAAARAVHRPLEDTLERRSRRLGRL